MLCTFFTFLNQMMRHICVVDYFEHNQKADPAHYHCQRNLYHYIIRQFKARIVNSPVFALRALGAIQHNQRHSQRQCKHQFSECNLRVKILWRPIDENSYRANTREVRRIDRTI